MRKPMTFLGLFFLIFLVGCSLNQSTILLSEELIPPSFEKIEMLEIKRYTDDIVRIENPENIDEVLDLLAGHEVRKLSDNERNDQLCREDRMLVITMVKEHEPVGRLMVFEDGEMIIFEPDSLKSETKPEVYIGRFGDNEEFYINEGEMNEIIERELAKQVATRYFEILYTLSDPSEVVIDSYESLLGVLEKYEREFEPYVTERMLQMMRGNRVVTQVTEVAHQLDMTLKVDQITLSQLKRDGDKIFMDCTVDIALGYSDGSDEIVIKNSKLQLIHVDREWKINHYKDINYPFELRIYP